MEAIDDILTAPILASKLLMHTLRLQSVLAVIGLLALASLLPTALASGPNAVTLRYFRAQARPASVFLEWETGTEVDHGGFQLYRSQIANDPSRGVLLSDDFPPRDEFSGGYYSYTDATVQVGVTYYYTLVALDLRGSETVYRPDPQAVTPGQAPATATPTATYTASPTQPAAPATNTPPPAATAPPTNTPPVATPTPAPAFATATQTTAPTQPGQPTVAPPTSAPTIAPAAPTDTAIPATGGIAPTDTPTLSATTPADTQEPRASAEAPVQTDLAPTAVQPGGVEPAETQVATVSPTPEPAATRTDLPTRAPRPTPRAEVAEPRSDTGVLLAVIAALAIGAAALLLGITIVLWVRSRNRRF